MKRREADQNVPYKSRHVSAGSSDGGSDPASDEIKGPRPYRKQARRPHGPIVQIHDQAVGPYRQDQRVPFAVVVGLLVIVENDPRALSSHQLHLQLSIFQKHLKMSIL